MSRIASLLTLLCFGALIGCGGRLDLSTFDDAASGDDSAGGDGAGGGASDGGASDGGASDGGAFDVGARDAGDCTPATCGPRPAAPAERCWDGSYASVTCGRLPSGACGWRHECPPPKPCTAEAGCGSAKLFCETPVGACGGAGTCAAPPEVCGKSYDPTCGCDHVTYVNRCEARRAGVSVDHLGPCEMPLPPPDKTCGGFPGSVCASSEYCSYIGGGCGSADGTGVCKPRPSGCSDVYAPVCGCDGKTYGNGCEAYRVGVDVRSTGACT